MKINLKTIGYLASGLVMIGAPIALIKSSHYTPRFEGEKKLTNKAQSWTGAAAYYHSLKADPTTGLIDKVAQQAAEQEAALRANNLGKKVGALGLNWSELGPDNVGGRVRAICFDKTRQNVIYAGGVSGGIFKSVDAGGSWTPINDQLRNMIISSISIDAAGNNLYFGTGENMFNNPSGFGGSEFTGSGLYKLDIATNAVTSVTSTTSSFPQINKVVCHPTNSNVILLGCDGNGFRISDNAGVSWKNVKLATSLVQASSGNVGDIKFTSDLNNSYFFSIGNSVYYSDLGNDIVSLVTPPASVITASNRVYIEIATAPSNSNVLYLSCISSASAGGLLGGIIQSVDKGLTWTRISQVGSPTFEPFNSGGQSAQGRFDNTISVDPTNPYRVFLGGVSFWKWEGNASAVGTWNYAAYQFAFGSQFYVHSDLHTLAWDPFNTSKLFVGGDGGINRSIDAGLTFSTINKGFNVTQAYAIAYERYPTLGINGKPIGGVMCGNQDNGTTYIPGNYNGDKGAFAVGGGDGNYCEFSQIAPKALFSSIYYGQVSRTSNPTTNGGDFTDLQYNSTAAANNGGPGAPAFASFVTPIKLWESNNVVGSIDSVDFVASPVLNNSVGTGNGSNKKFRSKINKSNLSSIFDSLYITLGTNRVAVNYTMPGSAYTVTLGVGSNTYTETRRDYITNVSSISTTITSSYYPTNDSVILKFASAPAFGDVIKTEMTQKYISGSGVNVKTNTASNTTFPYILPVNVPSRSKIRVPDYIQARLAIGLTNKVVVVKKPLNFAITPDWCTVASSTLSRDETGANSGYNGTVQTMAWSADGDNLYVGTQSGVLFRISHLKDLIDSSGVKGIDSLKANMIDSLSLQRKRSPIRCTRIGSFGNSITSISTNPLNNNDIVVTTGSYGSPRIYYATNPNTHPTATGLGLFVTKMGAGATGLITTNPIYSSLMEYKDTKRVLVGTEYGIYGTSDITAPNPVWTKENNNKLPNVPVFMLRQQTLNSYSCYNSGMIYAGTHGRGIWASDSYFDQGFVGINEIAPKDKTEIANIKLYPNPAREMVNLAFNIETSEQLVLNVYDLKGSLVYSKNLGKLPEGEQLLQVGTEDLISGTYIVSINSNSAIVGTSRLVVIK